MSATTLSLRRATLFAGAGRLASSRKLRPAIHQSTVRMQSAADSLASTSPTAATSKDDVKGPMLEPSPVNTPWARTAAVGAAIAAAAGSSALLPAKAAVFAHLAAWGALFGANLWNTFFVGLTMFKVVPRQMFGRVQAKLFPKFFTLSVATNVALLATLPLLPSLPPAARPWLYVCLATNSANWLVLEPLATRIMFQRYDLENKEDKGEEDHAAIKKLTKQFGKWHGISSLSNMVAFAAAVAHGWFLSTVVGLVV